MIGQFHFHSEPASEAVAIKLIWRLGKRVAELQISDTLSATLERDQFPPCGEEMGLPSAVSYAVFLGMHYDRHITICGDSSVWDERWGLLDHVLH